METHKSKTKFGGEIIIHTHCTLKELHEQIPGTEAYKKRIHKEFFQSGLENIKEGANKE